MLKDAPDHLDADLILKLYELRREAVMREARDALTHDFWPKNAKEAVAVLQHDHPLNRAYRQVSTYWEMVYRMARLRHHPRRFPGGEQRRRAVAVREGGAIPEGDSSRVTPGHLSERGVGGD